MVLWLLASPLAAQRFSPSVSAIGDLPGECTPGTAIIVNDGDDFQDCSSGGGAVIHACYCESGGSSYSAERPESKVFWQAGALTTDGAQCGDPTERQINGGPTKWTVNCLDSATSVFYGEWLLPPGYGGSTFIFALQAENENASPSGVFEFDFSAMCRGDGDEINSTWGSVAAISITFGTQFDVEEVESTAVTPNGTCVAGDILYWRAVMDNGATNTEVVDTYILSVTARGSW